MNVEVVYALAELQSLLSVDVQEGCTAIEAVKLSEICELHPEIDLDTAKLGIFGTSCIHDQVLQKGDRVEIYRPLLADPKEVRKRRAAEMAAKNAKK